MGDECVPNQLLWDLLWSDTEAARKDVPPRHILVYVDLADLHHFFNSMTPMMVGGREKIDLECFGLEVNETKTIKEF